jgi:hypothetical protein
MFHEIFNTVEQSQVFNDFNVLIWNVGAWLYYKS